VKSNFLVYIFIALNIAVYVMWSNAGEARMFFLENHFAVSWDALLAGRWWTLITSVFSHYMLLHLFFNMMVLNSFGPIIVEVLGNRFFFIFYLAAGVVSSLSHSLVTAFFLHAPNLPAVGASGSLAGILLLFCLLFPKEKILLMAIIPLPAIWAALAFVALDIWGLIAQSHGGGLPIGHGAHLGGAFCGLVAYFYVKSRGKNKRRL
jgi:membrane associated rhomboid family serine protease